jgi:mRNA deadenylase 3'-5' endonuclease subunit Ccr4
MTHPIVCFQEMHSNKNIEKYWEDEWGNKCVFSHHDSKSAGKVPSHSLTKLLHYHP